MTSILNKAIEAIEAKKEFDDGSNSTANYNSGLQEAINTIRSLLPAEKEQRKEDMRRGWKAGDEYGLTTSADFDTWYNQNEKR